MARENVKRVSVAKKPPAAGVLLREGRRVANDAWVSLADDEPAEAGADIIVSVKRLQAEGEALARRAPGARLGVLIGASEAVEEIAAYLPQLSLVAVDFPAYRDGRGLTTARLLRERYHYSGAVRAVGDVLQDLLFFMLRCGFDEFVLKANDAEAAFARAAKTFSLVYQPAADDRVTIGARRRGKGVRAEART
jgi:uncharacterized protein (DUF934 family)